MKTLKLIVVGLLLLFSVAAESQISVRINLGTPPQWGPAGYSDVRYYYLPDVEAYYDISNSMFIYNNGVTWVHRAYLPGRYRNYDLYNGYKVVMSDYRGNTPYTNFREYRTKYRKGYRGQPQKTFGQRPERGNSYQKGNSNVRGRSNERGIPKGRTVQKENRRNNKNSDRGHGRDKN